MVLKCPICCKNVEITEKELAHEKIKAECYCEKCDAYVEVIYPPKNPVDKARYCSECEELYEDNGTLHCSLYDHAIIENTRSIAKTVLNNMCNTPRSKLLAFFRGDGKRGGSIRKKYFLIFSRNSEKGKNGNGRRRPYFG
ncbi:hypothetical protein ACFVAI_01210 [Heyndrickxia sporothermodurans]